VTFTLWVPTNHQPVISGGEKAMWNRLWVFPFTVVVPKSEQIEQYGPRLARTHGSGILRWLVEGAQEFLAADRKLGPQPAAMEAQRRGWKRRDDVVLRWVEARTEADLHSAVRFPDCWADFQVWADTEGESAALKEYTSQKFHAELDDHYHRSAKPSNGAYKRLGMRLVKGQL
jgi:phage/plasmid-associated DNA primase